MILSVVTLSSQRLAKGLEVSWNFCLRGFVKPGSPDGVDWFALHDETFG